MRLSLGHLAFDAARRFGDREAFVFPGHRTLSFAELDQMAGRFAGALAKLGVGQGDAVVLHLPNSWEWLVAYHAVARLGGIVIPANILLAPPEIAFIAADSGARAVILPGDRSETINSTGMIAIAVGAAADTMEFDSLLDADWLEPCAVDPEDVCTIGYTSGTTGKPKGAMLSHRNIVSSVAQTATIHVRHAHDRIYSALPFPHVYGNVVLNSVLLAGAWLYAPQRFDAAQALSAIAEHRITLFEGVPTMYYQILSCGALDSADTTSLTRCTVGGQTMPVAKIEAVTEAFGCPLLELWGMTELGGPAISHSPYWPPRPGSVGLAMPGVEIRIADLHRDDEVSACGTPGELKVRGQLVTAGYWNNEGATQAAIDRDGWLATGDIATQDADGYVYIVDRKKDLILTGGYNVYPAELEQVIARHSSVAMVAVAGAPCAEKGEIAHAFIVLRSGVTADEAAILQHCRAHLASYKVPRRISFVSNLPMTSTGKILRRSLRDTPSTTTTSF